MAASSAQSFHDHMSSVSTAMMFVASKLPKEGMESFEVSNDGKFKVIYDKENVGTASHADPEWAKKSQGLSMKVSKTVTGKIDAPNQSVRIDEGCLVATKGKGILAVNISLTEIKEGKNGTADVTAKWGFLPEMTTNVAHTTLMLGNVAWKNKEL